MLEQWQQFLGRPPVWITLISAAFFNLASWGILLLNITPREEQIILHYTLSFGVDRVGMWYEAFFLPLLAFILLLVDLCFAKYLFRRSRIASFFFLISGAVFQLLAFLAALFLVIANLPVTT